MEDGEKRRSECGCNTNTVHSLTTLQVKWLTGVSCSGLIVAGGGGGVVLFFNHDRVCLVCFLFLLFRDDISIFQRAVVLSVCLLTISLLCSDYLTVRPFVCLFV